MPKRPIFVKDSLSSFFLFSCLWLGCYAHSLFTEVLACWPGFDTGVGHASGPCFGAANARSISISDVRECLHLIKDANFSHLCDVFSAVKDTIIFSQSWLIKYIRYVHVWGRLVDSIFYLSPFPQKTTFYSLFWRIGLKKKYQTIIIISGVLPVHCSPCLTLTYYVVLADMKIDEHE